MIHYNYCPECGNKIDQGAEPPHCSHCDKTFYRNAKPGASIMLVRDGKVLLGVRKNDPFKGAYDTIGGFVEEHEHPRDAAIREAKEETGLDVRVTSLLGIYIDRYGDNGDYTLNLQYTGEIISGEEKAMDDVARLEWVPIKDLPFDSGFQNAKDGLRDLKKLYEEGKL